MKDRNRRILSLANLDAFQQICGILLASGWALRLLSARETIQQILSLPKSNNKQVGSGVQVKGARLLAGEPASGAFQ